MRRPPSNSISTPRAKLLIFPVDLSDAPLNDTILLCATNLGTVQSKFGTTKTSVRGESPGQARLCNWMRCWAQTVRRYIYTRIFIFLCDNGNDDYIAQFIHECIDKEFSNEIQVNIIPFSAPWHCVFAFARGGGKT